MAQRSTNLFPWVGLALGLTALKLVSRSKPYRFRGKNVLITGGSRGLGLELARELARAGANLTLCARDEAELERAQDELGGRTTRCHVLVCDVTLSHEVKKTVEEAQRLMGSVDILVNNAGVIQVGPESTMTESDFEDALRTHFWGPFHAIQAALPGMRSKGEGRIVNISSIGGKVAPPHLLPYDVSKYALTGYSEGLSAELAQEGIFVTTVIPGLMRTGSPDNALFKGKHREEYTWFTLSDSIPLVTMSSRLAARRILDAVKAGKREIILTPAAKTAVALHGIFPSWIVRLLGLANRLLPGAGGAGARSVRGRDSHTRLAPSVLTVLTERAAARNNENPPAVRRAG
jgi:NAD(P)-dependent dehydrogenase (short-subunit alcohol dehydrogenase family)